MAKRADRKKYHVIYKTTCSLTNRYYIGMHSTDNLEDGYIGSGKRLGYSIKKHGLENHRKEILELCETREALRNREKELVNPEVMKDPLCMNLKLGGDGGWDHINDDDSQIERRKQQFANFQNRYLELIKEDPLRFKESREKSSQRLKQRHALGLVNHATFTGRKHTLETKNKISKAIKAAKQRNKE